MGVREVVADSVKSLKSKAKKGSFWTKWFWYLLVGLLGLALVVWLVVESFLKSRKAAEALHQRDVAVANYKVEKINQRVANKQREKEKYVVKAEKHLKKAQAKEKKAKEAKERVAKNSVLIKSIQEWDDVDKVVKY